MQTKRLLLLLRSILHILGCSILLWKGSMSTLEGPKKSQSSYEQKVVSECISNNTFLIKYSK